MVLYANPTKLRLIAERGRFDGTRTSFLRRLEAAWLVFTGRADALLWTEQSERDWQFEKDREEG